MTMTRQVHIILFCLWFGFCKPLYGWENKCTHPTITERAVNKVAENIDDYFKTQLGLSNGLSTPLYWDFPADIDGRIDWGDWDSSKTKTILGWLKTGSVIEDEDGRRWPIRSRHHFHDPTRNSGLDNQSDHPEWEQYACAWTGFDFNGLSALDWATVGTAQKEPRNNHDKWGTARTIFYQALKEEDFATREASLAESLVKLGCVLHLLEDMGVPAHTRNDFLFGHYRTWSDHGNDLENFIEKLGFFNWFGTSPVVFDTVAKYFDSGSRYDTGADAYYGGALPLTWGLSECTNYQFLSYSTVFGCAGTKYQFPHPSKDYCPDTLTVGNAIYFDGSNYGVSYMARKSYTYYVFERFGGSYTAVNSTISTDDDYVKLTYADITIPRTINYTAGLINYFFRGRLEVEAHAMEPGGSVAQITITNKSMNGTVQQALKGGDFELYATCFDGERIYVPLELNGWSNGILFYNGSLTGTFDIPTTASPIFDYGILYKGQIVPNGSPGHVDPFDGEAIAWGQTKTRVVLCFSNCAQPYQDDPLLYDTDLLEFREHCTNYKVALYFTQRQWPRPDDPYELTDIWCDDNPDDECTACCNSSTLDIIPEGYDYPQEVNFETCSVPVIASDIDNYGRDLLGGATPSLFLVIHSDRPSMYYTWDDWLDWEPNPCRHTFECPWPGEGSILENSLQDWYSTYEYGLKAIARDNHNRWLEAITWYVQYLEGGDPYGDSAIQNSYVSTALRNNFETVLQDNFGTIAISTCKKATIQYDPNGTKKSGNNQTVIISAEPLNEQEGAESFSDPLSPLP